MNRYVHRTPKYVAVLSLPLFFCFVSLVVISYFLCSLSLSFSLSLSRFLFLSLLSNRVSSFANVHHRYIPSFVTLQFRMCCIRAFPLLWSLLFPFAYLCLWFVVHVVPLLHPTLAFALSYLPPSASFVSFPVGFDNHSVVFVLFCLMCFCVICLCVRLFLCFLFCLLGIRLLI